MNDFIYIIEMLSDSIVPLYLKNFFQNWSLL